VQTGLHCVDADPFRAARRLRSACEKADFVFLRNLTGLTKGNLSLDATRMRLEVDGQVRFAGDGDYANVEAPLAIGPCFGSTVTVREFSVTTDR
jgi:hypothetical protein